MSLNEMIVIDLPSLQSITLGKYALYGRYDDYSSSLTMRSTNEMIEMIEYRSSKSNIDSFCFGKFRKCSSIDSSKFGNVMNIDSY